MFILVMHNKQMRSALQMFATLFNLIGYETLRWLIYPRNHEELRSGTWMTIRYAKKIGKKLVIIWPNGEPCED